MTEDPNRAVIDLEFDRAEEAEAFLAKLQELWGRVGDDLGLVGPEGRILELVESS